MTLVRHTRVIKSDLRVNVKPFSLAIQPSPLFWRLWTLDYGLLRPSTNDHQPIRLTTDANEHGLDARCMCDLISIWMCLHKKSEGVSVLRFLSSPVKIGMIRRSFASWLLRC